MHKTRGAGDYSEKFIWGGGTARHHPQLGGGQLLPAPPVGLWTLDPLIFSINLNSHSAVTSLRTTRYWNKKKECKGRYSSSWETHLTCHMGSHSVTCHPTQVNAPCLTPAMQADTRFTYPTRMEGWVDLVDLSLDSAPAGSRTSDLSITSPTPEPLHHQDNAMRNNAIGK